MIHSIIINYECPLCGFEERRELERFIQKKEVFTDFNCARCYGKDRSFVFTDPIGITHLISTEFNEPVKWIPSRPQYINLTDQYSDDRINHCDVCLKETECEEDEEPTTDCYHCVSSTHNKLVYLMENGFSYDELWNLDSSIASFIIPRLKKFMKTTHGYPNEIGKFEDWEIAIRKMLVYLRCISNGNYGDTEKGKRFEFFKEGMKLFHEHFHSLWD